MPSLDAQKIILALDTQSPAQAATWIDALFPPLTHAKIGLELFAKHGPQIFEMFKRPNLEFFLDLKLHDIPNTVYRAIQSLSPLPIKFLTIHASGGLAMLQAAQEAAQEKNIQLLAVTLLTSLDETQIKQIYSDTTSIADQVLRLAEVAAQAGITGLVCSPREIHLLRSSFGHSFTLVTPGIRSHPPATCADDQSRTLTAREALAAGADYLVVGRPITQAPSPQEALATLIHAL